MRARLLGGDNLEFANYLLKIGEGQEGEEVDGETWILIRPEIQSKSNTIQEFCSEIFPVIVPINDDAQEVNDILMRQLSGEEMVYKSADKLLNKKKCQGEESKDPEISDDLKFPPEYLNSISLPSMPPHRLVLKPGAPIMLMRNLDPQNGHVNGARYVVKSMHKHIIHAELATGTHKGKAILLPRIYFNPQGTPWQFMQRKQFPVKPCFAITSNKSQGANFEKSGNLPEEGILWTWSIECCNE